MSTYSASPGRASKLQLKTTKEERDWWLKTAEGLNEDDLINLLSDLDTALAALADTQARLAQSEAKTARLIDELDALQPKGIGK